MCLKSKNFINKINDNILFDYVRIIDDNIDSNKLFNKLDAILLAKKQKKDLVQFNVDNNISICRILDYKKFLYDKKKKEHENKKKNKKILLKEVYLKPNIGKSDLIVKFNKVKSLLQDGYRVKVIVKFSGRELNFIDLGSDLLKDLSYELCEKEKIASIYQCSNKIDNKQIFVILMFKK